MKFLGFILFIGFFTQQNSNPCRVSLDNINSRYEGECRRGLAHGFGIAEGIDRYEGQFKKGLPHGKGTYTWSNGDVYTGKWRKGQMHGLGRLTKAGNDIIYRGMWKDGEFVNDYDSLSDKPPYVIRYQKNITRIRFVKLSDGDNVFCRVDEAGGNRPISHVSTFGSSGQYLAYPGKFGFEKVTFPFDGKVVFNVPSRTGFTTFQIELIYEINEPGNWEIQLTY